MFPYPDFLLKTYAKNLRKNHICKFFLDFSHVFQSKISIKGLNPQTKYTEFTRAITHNKNIISHKNRFVKGFL